MLTLSGEHVIVSKGKSWKFRLHGYLCYFENKYWSMWSQGLTIEDRGKQCVGYSTSYDGLNWAEANFITPSEEKIRYISRGFWIRDDGFLRAIVSKDSVGKYFGPDLELQSFIWNAGKDLWEYEGVIFYDAISNFPPQKVSSGDWMIACRNQDRNISFLLGGVKSINSWKVIPFSKYEVENLAKLEEPDWIILPNDIIMCLLRDNSKSNLLLRSFSKDSGKTWSPLQFTDFPNATSKFHIKQISTGKFIIVNNRGGSKSFCLSTSNDGLVFDKVFYLSVPEVQVEKNSTRELFQYPHVIEKDGFLLISFSRRKQTIELLKIKLNEIV